VSDYFIIAIPYGQIASIPDSIVHPNVQDVFPDTTDSFEEFKNLLGQLSRIDGLIFCSRVNHILGKFPVTPAEKKIHKQENIARLFFKEEQVARMLNDGTKQRGFDEIAVATKGSSTLLARWICACCDNKEGDGKTFENEAIREIFAKALLIANQLWQRSMNMERLLDDVPEKEARFNMLSICRQNSAGSQAKEQPLITGIGKGVNMFFEPAYFSSVRPTFFEEFKEATGMTVEDYYTCITYITSGMEPDIRDGKVIGRLDQAIESVPDDFKATFSKFFELEAQSTDDLLKTFWGDCDPLALTDFADAPPFNDRMLRDRPIMTTPDGRMIIFDPVIFHDKAVDGALFTLLKLKKVDGTALFGDFGDAFEDYIHEVLKGIYPKSSLYDLLSTPLEYQLKEDSEPSELTDACLDYGEDIVLFEIKASFLKQDNIIYNDNDKYVAMLREKYVTDDDGSPKGVTQLANAINVLNDEKCKVVDRDFTKVKRIFPVLLLHDDLIDSILHSHFFHNEFKNALEPDRELKNGYFVKGKFHVAPLTLMTVENLESLEFSILKKGLSLKDVLENYVDTYPDRIRSLHYYFGASNQDLFVNQRLATSGLEMITKTKNRLFPK